MKTEVLLVVPVLLFIVGPLVLGVLVAIFLVITLAQILKRKKY
jgi:Na+/H+ antiporter NhaB